MDINRTLDVTKEAMKKDPNIRRPDTLLLELLETTLKNNDFTFNGGISFKYVVQPWEKNLCTRSS